MLSTTDDLRIREIRELSPPNAVTREIPRTLTATRDMNNAWVVTAGVDAGDKLIVDGLQKISDGAAVTPVLVEISEDGVVYQDMKAAAPAGNGTAPAGMPALPEGATPPAEGATPPAAGTTQTTESAQ